MLQFNSSVYLWVESEPKYPDPINLCLRLWDNQTANRESVMKGSNSSFSLQKHADISQEQAGFYSEVGDNREEDLINDGYFTLLAE